MKTKLIVLLVVASGLVGGYWWHTQSLSDSSVVNLGDGFEMKTCITQAEKDFIRRQFKENWSNLISSPNYDIEYFLEKRGIYPFQPEYEGTMQIKVLYKDNEMVGFSAYYLKSPSEGSILFIEVDKAYRGKRYAEKLVRYATQDLQRLGADYVRFSTGAHNTSAQKLYDRLGYQRFPWDTTHIGYRYSFK